jgi:Ubiquitin family
MYADRVRVPCESLVLDELIQFVSDLTCPIAQETIASLKEKVQEASEIAAARQRIIFKGAEVHNHVRMRAAGMPP